MDDTKHDEQCQCACHKITSEDGCEHEVGKQIQWLAGKSIQQVARERTNAQGCYGVA